MMKKFLLLAFVLFIFSESTVIADDFTGVITFRKVAGNDTLLYKYYIIKDKIRVEDINKDGEINGIMLINLLNSKIVLLSGSKKVYKDFPASIKKFPDLNLEIEKTKKKMKVAKQNCNLWKVTEKISGEKFEFWISKKNYTFFNRMLKVLNRKEIIAQTWLKLEVSDNMFPMIGIQYNSEGELVTKIEVIKIEERELPEEIFFVPADYELIEKLH